LNGGWCRFYISTEAWDIHIQVARIRTGQLVVVHLGPLGFVVETALLEQRMVYLLLCNSLSIQSWGLELLFSLVLGGSNTAAHCALAIDVPTDSILLTLILASEYQFEKRGAGLGLVDTRHFH
jgi:hypothetical protein